MRNKRGIVLCLGLVAAMMLFASSLQALPLTSQVYAYTINWSAAADSATQSLVNRFWDVDNIILSIMPTSLRTHRPRPTGLRPTPWTL